MSEITKGKTVIVYDRFRFAIPLKGYVALKSEVNDGVMVVLLESNNKNYPIGKEVWVHESQLGLEEDDKVSIMDAIYKKGDELMFYGNRVKVKWVDHSYITIEFILQSNKADIAINCPKNIFVNGCNKWLESMSCFEKVTK